MLRLCAGEGILPHRAEEMTWGEALLFLRGRQEAERQRAQRAALIAWEQAALTARAVLEGNLGEVYEYFPFWTDEEVRELRVEKYRTLLERMAGKRAGEKAAPEPGEGGTEAPRGSASAREGWKGEWK